MGIVGIVGRVDASVGDGSVPSTKKRISILDICNEFHVYRNVDIMDTFDCCNTYFFLQEKQ